jgi:hypothetical protein
VELVREVLPKLTPAGIIDTSGGSGTPFFRRTARVRPLRSHGDFDFTWELTDKAEALKAEA